MWILAAKLPNSDLNFAVDFLVDFFLLFFPRKKARKNPPKNPPQNSPGTLFGKIPLGFLQRPFLDKFTRTIWGKIHRFLLLSGSGNRSATTIHHLSHSFCTNVQLPLCVRRAPSNLEKVAKNPVEKIASNPVTSVAGHGFFGPEGGTQNSLCEQRHFTRTRQNIQAPLLSKTL